jgi:predicted peptidase
MNSNERLHYAEILPQDYQPDREYPILLALPPGEQSQAMVSWGLIEYWRAEAIARNWIVVSPVAPSGRLFFEGSETLIPQFLAGIAEKYHPEGGKFHIGGISNGGRSGFRIAVEYPELFHSLMVLPGYPDEQDFEKLANLRNMPVTMFVGEFDIEWIAPMQRVETMLTELNGQVSLEIVPREDHVIQQLLGGKHLFDLLEGIRR